MSMKSFSQFLTEKNALAAAALASSLVFSGAASQPTQEPSQNVEQNQQTEDPYSHFGGQHNEKLYRGIMAAEFRGKKIDNPLDFDPKLFIRTQAVPPKTKNKKGQLVQMTSTAYGPAQITMSTVSAMRKDKRTADLFNDGDENYTNYLNSFEEQGKKMKTTGNVKGGKYGLGGCGDLCSEEHNKNYQKMAVAVMRGKMRELGIDDTKPLDELNARKFAQSWAGPHFSETYMNAFSETYNK